MIKINRGHSTVSDMYGTVITKADSGEEIVYAEIDLDKLNETRTNLPYLSQKRNDIYEVKQLK